MVKPSPSAMMHMAYTEATMDKKLRDLDQELQNVGPNPTDKEVSYAKQEQMLLDQSSGELIAEYLQVPEMAAEIKRAVWQVERSLNAKHELGEEKSALEQATTKPN